MQLLSLMMSQPEPIIIPGACSELDTSQVVSFTIDAKISYSQDYVPNLQTHLLQVDTSYSQKILFTLCKINLLHNK